MVRKIFVYGAMALMVIAIVGMTWSFVVSPAVDSLFGKISEEDQSSDSRTNNAPGTTEFYKPYAGTYYDPEFIVDTLKIDAPSGFETRPSVNNAAQIATTEWLQSVTEWSKNRDWKSGNKDQGEGMMGDLVDALENNHIRYFREKYGDDSYTIRMAVLKGNVLKGIELTPSRIRNVNFENDVKKLTDVFPVNNEPASDTSSTMTDTYGTINNYGYKPVAVTQNPAASGFGYKRVVK